jgi:hypothetical protein
VIQLQIGDKVRYLQDPNHPDRPREPSSWVGEVVKITEKMVEVEILPKRAGRPNKRVMPHNLEKVWR